MRAKAEPVSSEFLARGSLSSCSYDHSPIEHALQQLTLIVAHCVNTVSWMAFQQSFW